jgi:hypothetical protein
LIFDQVPPLLVFFLAHLIEALLFLRYHILLPFFALRGQKPGLTPRWIGQLVYLQPATLQYLRDVVIDDSRARKMIGYWSNFLMQICYFYTDGHLENSYKPQWQTAQIMKYTVDQLESGKTDGRHGLQVPSSGS